MLGRTMGYYKMPTQCHKVEKMPKELFFINHKILNTLNEIFIHFINALILKKINWKTDIARKPPTIGLDNYCMIHSVAFNKYLKPRGMNHKYEINILITLQQMTPRCRYYYNV